MHSFTMFSKVGRSDQRSFAFHGSNSGKGARVAASQASIELRGAKAKAAVHGEEYQVCVKALRRLVSGLHALGLSRVDCGK